MKLSSEVIEEMSKEYGESFYILDSKQFRQNYEELLGAFREIYPKSYIAYSYKTNYIPKICKIVDEYGGYAEVVSDMEYRVAIEAGVSPDKICLNGPYKSRSTVEELLLAGGTVNIDSSYELEIVTDIAKRHWDRTIEIGIRCNLDIGNGATSRFGFDVEGPEFSNAIQICEQVQNIRFVGLHCHYGTRSLESWSARAETMLALVRKYFVDPPEYISLGGGMFGKMGESLKEQFGSCIPSYKEYAEAVAPWFRAYYQDIVLEKQPKLFIEPGSALVGDAMKFAAKVINIKDIRGKKIATLAGSLYNINPTWNKKNLPITVYHHGTNPKGQAEYVDLDFGGYTCIESDYLYRGFHGRLSVGDHVMFDNVGSYSIVLKPPFILPNFAIVDYDDETGAMERIRRRETYEDLFQTYE